MRDPLSLLFQISFRAQLNALLNGAEGLLRVTKPVSLPISLDIVLTKACNLRCVFCVSYGSLKSNRWLSFDLYETIAKTLFPTACQVLFCSGGEPFLYPRIRDALRLVREHGTVSRMISNGTLINQETAGWLVGDQNLHDLMISFDGARKETVERIRRGSNYDTILSNLDYLNGLKKSRRLQFPRVSFRYAIMKSNVEELPEIFEIASRLGLNRVDVNYVKVANDMDDSESLVNDPTIVQEVFRAARRKAKEWGISLGLPPVPGEGTAGRRCLWPWNFCMIDTDGSIRFCHSAWRQRIGFFDQDFARLWKGEIYRKIRGTVDTVNPYFPYCKYCAVRTGVDSPGSHDLRLPDETCGIPGLEHLQVPFNERARESALAFIERKS